MTLRDFEASYRISAGQDKSYGADGQLHSCRSLAFEAEARIVSLGKAARNEDVVAAAEDWDRFVTRAGRLVENLKG